MRIAYFDVYSGISGDMTIGAFLDAGLDIDVLRRELAKLKLKGYEIKQSKVKRGAISGTKFDVIIKTKQPGHGSLKGIIALIDDSPLSERVRAIAKEIFLAIGRAEAKVHGSSPKGDIHLHELADLDSIIDIVGTAVAIDELGIDEVHSSDIILGRTIVNTRAGRLPTPAPATLELLNDCPVRISNIASELVTPTGAAILKTLSKGFGEMPQMTITRIGYGAGSQNLKEMPNMLRVMIGERQESFAQDKISVIETNIDDISPQTFEYLFDKLLKEGALDVYTTHIQMKKSRPAFKLTALAEPAKLGRIATIIFSETTTIGMRFYEAGRFKLERKLVKAHTKYGDVTVKLSKGPDNISTVSPEYEECAALARKKKVPLKTIYEEAKHAVKI